MNSVAGSMTPWNMSTIMMYQSLNRPGGGLRELGPLADVALTSAGVTFLPGHFLYVDLYGIVVAESELNLDCRAGGCA